MDLITYGNNINKYIRLYIKERGGIKENLSALHNILKRKSNYKYFIRIYNIILEFDAFHKKLKR